MLSDALTAAAGIVAGAIGGMATGAVEGLGDRAVAGTLDAIREASGRSGQTARNALSAVKNAPSDRHVAALAKAIADLAESNAKFQKQLISDSKQVRSTTNIYAGQGAHVYVGQPQPADNDDDNRKAEAGGFKLSSALGEAFCDCVDEVRRWLMTAHRVALMKVAGDTHSVKRLLLLALVILVDFLFLPIALLLAPAKSLVASARRYRDGQTMITAVVYIFIAPFAVYGLLTALFSSDSTSASLQA